MIVLCSQQRTEQFMLIFVCLCADLCSQQRTEQFMLIFVCLCTVSCSQQRTEQFMLININQPISFQPCDTSVGIASTQERRKPYCYTLQSICELMKCPTTAAYVHINLQIKINCFVMFSHINPISSHQNHQRGPLPPSLSSDRSVSPYRLMRQQRLHIFHRNLALHPWRVNITHTVKTLRNTSFRITE